MGESWGLDNYHSYNASTQTVMLGSGGEIKNKSKSGYSSPLDTNGHYNIPSEDGQLIYQFDSNGKHLNTRDAVTNVTLVTFQYTGPLMTSMMDRDGLVTQIQRNASGYINHIVNPFGATTDLTYDVNNQLVSVEDPSGATQSFSYHTGTNAGLMSSMTDALNKTKYYDYDSSGKLVQTTDRKGGVRTFSADSYTWGTYHTDTVTSISPMGLIRTYKTSLNEGSGPSLEDTLPSGLVVNRYEDLTGLRKIYGDYTGVSVQTDFGVDLRFPERLSAIEIMDSTAGGGVYDFSKSFTFNPIDPSVVDQLVETTTLNGSNAYVMTYDRASNSITRTSPLNKQILAVIDNKGRVVSQQKGDLAAETFTYNSYGQMTSSTQGSRTYTYTYNSSGLLETVTDPLSQTTTYAYDANGRLILETLPDSTTHAYSYNANGDMNLITNSASTNYAYSFDDNQNVVNFRRSPPSDSALRAIQSRFFV